jgi:hypothetical protein
MTVSLIDQPEFPDEWIGKLIRTDEGNHCHDCFTYTCRVISNKQETCVRCGTNTILLAGIVYTLVDRVVLIL